MCQLNLSYLTRFFPKYGTYGVCAEEMAGAIPRRKTARARIRKGVVREGRSRISVTSGEASRSNRFDSYTVSGCPGQSKGHAADPVGVLFDRPLKNPLAVTPSSSFGDTPPPTCGLCSGRDKVEGMRVSAQWAVRWTVA